MDPSDLNQKGLRTYYDIIGDLKVGRVAVKGNFNKDEFDKLFSQYLDKESSEPLKVLVSQLEEYLKTKEIPSGDLGTFIDSKARRKISTLQTLIDNIEDIIFEDNIEIPQEDEAGLKEKLYGMTTRGSRSGARLEAMKRRGVTPTEDDIKNYGPRDKQTIADEISSGKFKAFESPEQFLRDNSKILGVRTALLINILDAYVKHGIPPFKGWLDEEYVKDLPGQVYQKFNRWFGKIEEDSEEDFEYTVSVSPTDIRTLWREHNHEDLGKILNIHLNHRKKRSDDTLSLAIKRIEPLAAQSLQGSERAAASRIIKEILDAPNNPELWFEVTKFFTRAVSMNKVVVDGKIKTRTTTRGGGKNMADFAKYWIDSQGEGVRTEYSGGRGFQIVEIDDKVFTSEIERGSSNKEDGLPEQEFNQMIMNNRRNELTQAEKRKWDIDENSPAITQAINYITAKLRNDMKSKKTDSRLFDAYKAYQRQRGLSQVQVEGKAEGYEDKLQYVNSSLLLSRILAPMSQLEGESFNSFIEAGRDSEALDSSYALGELFQFLSLSEGFRAELNDATQGLLKLTSETTETDSSGFFDLEGLEVALDYDDLEGIETTVSQLLNNTLRNLLEIFINDFYDTLLNLPRGAGTRAGGYPAFDRTEKDESGSKKKKRITTVEFLEGKDYIEME